MPKLPPPSATPKMQDHIFISYSSKDRAFVDQLADKLRGLGHTVWIDFEGIRGGEKWKQSISDGLHPSRVVLLVLSPDSIQSEWVEEEIRTALALGKTIIPLLLRPLPDDIPSEILRDILQEIQYRDFTGGFQQPFEQLLEDLPKPESGIRGYCARLIARIAKQPWGLDHYIQGQSKLLPIHASPYDEGLHKQASENLLKQLWEGHRTIVLGEPGMGKSVAVERLAWELASAEPPTVPVIINLREYDGQPLLEWIRLTLVASDEPAIRHALRRPDAIEQYLHDTPFTFYILLDGLNEVRPDYRETVLQEIRRLSLAFPAYPMAVTSRIQDESWRELRGGSFNAVTLVVQSITIRQAQIYLIAHLSRNEAAKLWRKLDPRMRGLTATPLLLWLIKEAWLETRGRVPGNRGELYASFIERMLRRDDERKLSASISKEKRLSALQTLASAMHNQRAVSFTRQQASDSIGNEQVLDALLVNGLLQGEDVIRFAPHQTIQEHFAARAIQAAVESELNKPAPSWWQKIISRPQDSMLDLTISSWWAETFIQLAGITRDPNQLAQKIAERNPWLAWWCVQEGGDVEPETERIIQAQSEKLVDSDAVNDRRNAVQALLKLPRARVIDQLAKLAVDVDTSVSKPAQAALEDLGEVGEQAIQRAFPVNFSKRIMQLEPVKRAEYVRQWAKYDKRPGIGVIIRDGVKLPDIDWVKIPVGEFTMGHESESDNPPRILTLDYDYHIARYPVTYAQFQTFIDDSEGYRNRECWFEGLAADDGDKEMRDQQFKYANHPRETVNWYQAVAFCRWLSWRLGGGYALDAVDQWAVRLPTEFEWEKAARANTGWKYPWGNDYHEGYANIDETETNAGQYYLRQTSAVGIYPQGNAPHWSQPISDLSGNVWEWCLTDYKNPQMDATKENLSSSARRVLRGGSCYNTNVVARAVYRNVNSPVDRNSDLGFRCVCLPH